MGTQLSTPGIGNREIGRARYAIIGVLLFALKHNFDRFVASLAFHRQFSVFNYWVSPAQALRVTTLPRKDLEFLLTMLAMALPFIGIGVMLTVRRLRSIGLPLWLAVLFFLPILNLVFFLILSVLPAYEESASPRILPPGRPNRFLDRVIPDGAWGSAAIAALFSVPVFAAATYLATSVLHNYGWGLFVALPFCLGLLSALIYGYQAPRSLKGCLGVSCASALLLGGALLLLAFEGVICLLMALPIALPLAALGGALGYTIQRRPPTMQSAPAVMMSLLLFVPGLMGYERAAKTDPPVFAVQTAINVNAPPEVVWRQVVTFSEIPPPTEALFRLGIAYPVRATITGHGPGAVRHCEFTTGPFVEPITVWDEPRLLRFSVTENPAAMQEWTLYKDVHPAHLHGFLVSRQGQFLLTPLPGGGTRLEGTTWYLHGLWPASYWQVWSDNIIHQIHLRVLRHIKNLAEQDVDSQMR
jgi:uncharacterized membrane protein YhaH (DUF805 family)